MSSTFSSVRSSPIPDFLPESYRSLRAASSTRGDDHEIDSIKRPQLRSNGANGAAEPRRREKKEQFVPTRPMSILTVNGANHDLKKFSTDALAFWTLLTLLALLVLLNSILTILVFGVLRVGIGMQSIEFLPTAIKFFGMTDLDEIYKPDGILEGFLNIPMEMMGDSDGSLQFDVLDGSQPSLTVSKKGVNVSNVKEFRVVDRIGKEVFSTNMPTVGLPRGVQYLDVRVAKVNRIASAINSTLTVRSSSFAYLKGSEGTRMEGKQILWAADQDIFLKSVNGNIILNGRDGVTLDVNSLPLVKDSGVTRNSYTYATQGHLEPQFQLCICMPEGKLFKVEIPVGNQQRSPSEQIGCHSPLKPC